MKFYSNSNATPIITILLITIFYSLTIRNGNPWSGDFSQYIMQAKAIVAGNIEGYFNDSRFRIDNSEEPGKSGIGPLYYPWGFPVMIAPLIFCCGVNFMLLKLFGIMFIGLSTYIVNLLFKNRISVFCSFIVIILFAFNPDFLFFKDYITADFPHLFFILFTFFLINKWIGERSTVNKNIYELVFIGIMIFFSTMIRMQAIVLIPTIIFLQLYKFKRNILTKDILFLLIPTVVFFMLYIIEKLIINNYSRGSVNYIYPDESIFLKIINNGKYYLSLPITLLEFKVTFQGVLMKILKVVILLIYNFVIAVTVLGMIKNFARNASFVFFTFFNIVLFFYFPYHQGLRYLYPILPFMIYFFILGLIFIIDKLVSVRRKAILKFFAMVCLTLYVFSVGSVGIVMAIRSNNNINGPENEHAKELFNYVKKNTSKNSVIVFHEPRIMSLYTGRPSIFLNRLRIDNLGKWDHYVCEKDNLIVLPKETESKVSIVYENSEYIVYNKSGGERSK